MTGQAAPAAAAGGLSVLVLRPRRARPARVRRGPGVIPLAVAHAAAN